MEIDLRQHVIRHGGMKNSVSLNLGICSNPVRQFTKKLETNIVLQILWLYARLRKLVYHYIDVVFKNITDLSYLLNWNFQYTNIMNPLNPNSVYENIMLLILPFTIV